MSTAYIEKLEKRLSFERQRTEVLLEAFLSIENPRYLDRRTIDEIISDTKKQLDVIDEASDEQAEDPSCWPSLSADADAQNVSGNPA